MITINEENDVVTLINVFTCEPDTQQALIDAWIKATEHTLGRLPGIVSASLHRKVRMELGSLTTRSGSPLRPGKTWCTDRYSRLVSRDG